MTRMHEATEIILQAGHPDAWTEVTDLREALLHLAYAISPDHKNLAPDWNVLSYEPHFAEAMERARHALGVKLPAKEF